MRKIFSLLAAVLFAGSMMATTVTKTVADLATELSFTNSEVCTPFALDEVITVSTNATDANTGKYYTSGQQVRLYQSGAAELIISAAEGYTISSITLTYVSQNTGILVEAASGEAVAFENVQTATFTVGNSGSATNGQVRITSFSVTYAADGEGGEPVEPGDEPSVLQAVSDSTTWDFSKITANTANALYNKEGIQLTDESTPSKNDEVIYADYSEDFMTIGEEFNKAAIAFKGEYPIRKNQYCQAGTLHFKADVAGTIVVKFSDTGTSASATAVKRYLVVNGVQTEDWTSRENNGEEAYDAQLNVVSDKIEVPAGDVTITGSSAIVVYYVTFVPAKQDEPVLADTLTCAQAAELAAAGKTDEVIVKGYVTEIAYAWASGSMSFWMADTKDGGKVFEAYKCAIAKAEDAVIVGDLVAAKGSLTYYAKTSTPELAAGCTVEILEAVERPVVEPAQNLGAKTIAEFLELKNTKDTCVLTGVVSNITNATYGNYDLVELNNEEVSVAIYGTLTPEGASQQFESLNVAEGDTLTVKAVYREYNGKVQPKNVIFVEVKKAAVEPGETIEISLTSETANVDWKDATASQGWWQMRAWNDNYFITLSNAGSLTQAAGTYTVADLDPVYSYILAYNETDTVRVDFTEGSVEVTDNGEGTVSVAGTLTGSDGNAYAISIISLPDPYKYDEAEADFEYTFESYKSQVGQGYAIVQAQTNAAMIALAIFLPQGQTELVVGEYEVSATPAYGTVYAGSYDNGFNPSFAATLVEEEGSLYYNQIWYLVSGKVTLDENLNITVDALNSNEKTVKATLKAQSQGIEDVNAAAKAVKSIVNGQLIIEKNGVQYNAQGAVIR